jgi:uncharacterized protein YdiU (UPF0061 family)
LQPLPGKQTLDARLLLIAGKPLTPEREGTWAQWVALYRSALKVQDLDEAQRKAMQDSANPVYIPRQHLLQVCGHA